MYNIYDKDGGRYIGQTEYDETLTLKENLYIRFKQHRNKNVSDDQKSPVLKMNKPRMKPFYKGAKNPYYIYGKYDEILKIEENHINKIMRECKKNNKKYYNRAGTKERPVIDEDAIKTVIVIDEEIVRTANNIVITQEKEPSKKDPNRMTNVINNKFFTEVMGFKGKKVRKGNKAELEKIRIKGISKMCMVTEDKVREVLDSKKR